MKHEIFMPNVNSAVQRDSVVDMLGKVERKVIKADSLVMERHLTAVSLSLCKAEKELIHQLHDSLPANGAIALEVNTEAGLEGNETVAVIRVRLVPGPASENPKVLVN